MPKTSFADMNWRQDPMRLQLVAPATLESWSGYSCETSAPESQGAAVTLVVADPDVSAPGLAHANYAKAVDFLFENEQRIHQSVATSLLAYLPKLRKQFEEWGMDEPALEANTWDEVRAVVNPVRVHLFPHTKAGLPYFGFEFDCAWDVEHGFNVLLHGTAVVALGLELEACDALAIEENGGTVDG